MRNASLVLVGTFFFGCIEPVQKPLSQAAQSEIAPQVLEDVGSRVIIPTLELFIESADLLTVRLEALEAEPFNNEILTEAQAQWIESANLWQQLELMQIGPAGSSLSVPGGQDMRDEIYSWPTVNPVLLIRRLQKGCGPSIPISLTIW